MLLIELARALVPPLLGVKAAVPPFGDAVYAARGVVDAAAQPDAGRLQRARERAVRRVAADRPSPAPAPHVAGDRRRRSSIITAISDNGAFINGGWVEAGFGLLIIGILTLIVLRFGLLTTSVGAARGQHDDLRAAVARAVGLVGVRRRHRRRRSSSPSCASASTPRARASRSSARSPGTPERRAPLPARRPLRARGRRRRPRILGPRVLRIASAQFLADLRVRAIPEAPQVARHLHRTAVRREQLQQDRLAARADARRSRPGRRAPAA